MLSSWSQTTSTLQDPTAVSQPLFCDLSASFVIGDKTVALLGFWDTALARISAYFSGHAFSFFLAESPASFHPSTLQRLGDPPWTTFHPLCSLDTSATSFTLMQLKTVYMLITPECLFLAYTYLFLRARGLHTHSSA